jgi:HEAT repeat protein
MFRKVTSLIVTVAFFLLSVIPPGTAQIIPALQLPAPGAMVGPSAAYVPVLLKGMTLHPENPFRFDFIVDNGHSPARGAELEAESERLVKYFMAALTVPQDDLWVNLSPNEPGRIITADLSRTELGRDLLAQDYILKQLTATLMYPEGDLGREFWERIHEQARTALGTSEIPTETFHKVWILPESATVYEHNNTVYIVASRLKVMMEDDYLSMAGVQGQTPAKAGQSVLASDIMKEVILPAIEKEVNEGANFAPLRQIYHSLILAKWYKQTVKDSLLSQVYIDQNKVSGVDNVDPSLRADIYDRYMDAYKQGVYSYMKEDYDAASQTIIPRKYFSGGFTDTDLAILSTGNEDTLTRDLVGKESKFTSLGVDLKSGSGSDQAMLLTKEIFNRLFADLYGANQSEAVKAAGALGYSGDPRAAPLLINWFQADTGPAVRKAVAEALRMLNLTPEHLNTLAEIRDGLKGNGPVFNKISDILYNSGDLRGMEVYRHNPQTDKWEGPFKRLSYPADYAMLNEIVEKIKFAGSTPVAYYGAAGLLVLWNTTYFYFLRKQYRVDKNLVNLNSPDEEVRAKAAGKLGGLNDRLAVKPLIERLSDRKESPPVHRAAAEALAKLQKLLSPADLYNLAQINEESPAGEVSSIVSPLLEGKNELIKNYGAELREIMYPKDSANPADYAVLGSWAPVVLSQALTLPQELVEKALEHSTITSLGIVAAGAGLMVALKIFEKYMVELYIRKLVNYDHDTRLEAVKVLSKLRSPQALGPLLPRLSDWSSKIRAAAHEALIKSGAMPEQMVYGYRHALSSPYPGARADAIIKLAALALSNTKNKGRIVAALTDVFSRDKNSYVKQTAQEALAQLTSEKPYIKEVPGSTSSPGGIDMNAILVDRQGAGLEFKFDPAVLDPLIRARLEKMGPADFQTFTPVIINFQPIPSILPLLGLEPAVREETLVLGKG